jgi:hypothetical protein
MVIRFKRDFFYTTIPIVSYFVLLFVFASVFVSAQKTAHWQSYHVQNNTHIIIPFTDNSVKKVNNIKSTNYTIAANTSKSLPINNSISYIITNATITVSEKVAKGIDLKTVKQTFTEPSETILFAKRYQK